MPSLQSHDRETDRLLSGQQPASYAATESPALATPTSPPTLQRATTLSLLWTPLPDTIDNCGSTARDFYAAERNYLSWLRLSLAIMATGAAAIDGLDQLRSRMPCKPSVPRLLYWQFDIDDGYGRPIGALLFMLAIFTAVASIAVFYHTHAQLAALRRPLRWSSMLSLAVAFSFAAASLAAALVHLLALD
ncbi:hypothetical protein LPJ53_003647 [Coemansia erecta]|uniref:DUF202 domain-containing protein n=1 Tax=Coemansia erecta TaxID=147472 RepID=A0A9W7XZM8_9FUNG|nr:hypothetical protein LPJ53_003647 [Coemansia erecta]